MCLNYRFYFDAILYQCIGIDAFILAQLIWLYSFSVCLSWHFYFDAILYQCVGIDAFILAQFFISVPELTLLFWPILYQCVGLDAFILAQFFISVPELPHLFWRYSLSVCRNWRIYFDAILYQCAWADAADVRRQEHDGSLRPQTRTIPHR